MSIFLIAVLLTIGAMIAVGLYRVFAGPTVFDRLVAVSLLNVNSVVMIAVLGFVFARPALFLDIALSYALLAFLFPIALGRYFEHDRHAEPRETAPAPPRPDDGTTAPSQARADDDQPRSPRTIDDPTEPR